MTLDFSLMMHSLPQLLKGALVTLQISFLSSLLGFSLGTCLGILQGCRSVLIRCLVYAYITAFRGTPMLVQILFVYYVLPEMGLSLPPIVACSLAIGLNSAAYVSQTILAGIRSVPKGQLEAAQTLGLSRWVTTRSIILPQAFSVVLPALGNEFITLIKDSSLASIIGVMELTKEASIIRSRTYDAFSVLLLVAMLYFFLTTFFSFLIHQLEQRMGIHAPAKQSL